MEPGSVILIVLLGGTTLWQGYERIRTAHALREANANFNGTLKDIERALRVSMNGNGKS